jgi:hypothetical protein
LNLQTKSKSTNKNIKMKEALLKLREELRKNKGSIKRIAETIGCTDVWVMRVLSGKVHNQLVIDTALEVLVIMKAEKIAKDKEKAQLNLELENRIMLAVAN